MQDFMQGEENRIICESFRHDEPGNGGWLYVDVDTISE